MRRRQPYKRYENKRSILCYAKLDGHYSNIIRNNIVPSKTSFVLVCKVIKKTGKVYWLKKGLSLEEKNQFALMFDIREYWVSTNSRRQGIGVLIADAIDCKELVEKPPSDTYSLLSTNKRKFCTAIYFHQRQLMQKAGLDHLHKVLLGTKCKMLIDEFNAGVSAKKIRTMVKKYGVDITCEYISIGRGYPTLKNIPPRNMRTFLKLMGMPSSATNFYGEQETQASTYCVRDTDSMYGLMIESNPSYKLPFKGAECLDDVHNIIARDYERVVTENKVIPWTDSQLKRFNQTVDSVKFKLPIMTHDLIDVGQKMHNCVSSYAMQIVDGYTMVVVGYREGEPSICIEIRRDKATQVLGPCNHKLKGEDDEIANKYFEEVGIERSCYAW